MISNNIENIANDRLAEVRNKIVNTTLIVTTVLATFALIGSLNRVFITGFHFIFLSHVACYVALVIILIFRRKLNFKMRALSLIGLFFILGFMGLYSSGLATNSVASLLVGTVLATIMFG